MFRDHVWVDQQLHGEAEFDVALSLFDVDITTGKTTRCYHTTARSVCRFKGRVNHRSVGRHHIFRLENLDSFVQGYSLPSSMQAIFFVIL
jgi:hypothetical protein